MSTRTAGILFATATALSWAVLAIVLKFALAYFSPGTIVWVRMILAFSILGAYFVFKKRDSLQILIQPPVLGLLGAAMIAVNYFGFMKGVQLTGADNSQIMIQSAPLSFALLSILIFKEFPTRRQFFGMTVAAVGFAFFYWDQILMSLGKVERFWAGDLWLAIAAVTWVIFALAQKFLVKRYEPQQLNLLIYGVSAVLLFPAAHLSELHHLSVWMMLLILFMALNTVIAYGSFAEAVKLIPAAHVSMILAVNPLLTLSIMTYLTQMEVEWIKGEPMHWRGYLGAILVVSGVILTVAQPRRLKAQALSPRLET